MESTECIFGMLKRRFPIIKAMRTHLDHSMAISLCVCILHNIAITWDMPDPPPGEDPEEPEEEVILLEEDLERAEVRARGSVLRDRLKNNMPPATASELLRIRNPN